MIKLNKKEQETISSLTHLISEMKVYTNKDINLKSCDLNHWKRKELIFFEKNKKEDKKKSKYTLEEIIWLKIIQEFRMLGVGLDVIKKFRNFLDTAYQQGFKNNPEWSAIKTKLLNNVKNQEHTLPKTPLQLLIAVSIIKRQDVVIMLTTEEKSPITIWSETEKEKETKIKFNTMERYGGFLAVSIKKLMLDLNLEGYYLKGFPKKES
jgi:DNA-binding transcriptional MerR regulator|tara:strand:- start:1922 stop:2545 length:624 start_codon:yes stop_codon:yes gene_type:complete